MSVLEMKKYFDDKELERIKSLNLPFEFYILCRPGSGGQYASYIIVLKFLHHSCEHIFTYGYSSTLFYSLDMVKASWSYNSEFIKEQIRPLAASNAQRYYDIKFLDASFDDPGLKLPVFDEEITLWGR